jgi:hypothetical protein
LDAYVVGALFVLAAAMLRRKPATGRLLFSAAWGFAGGICYRSFFEQLADPARRSGHEVLVLGVKGSLLAVTVLALAITIRPVATRALK